tara:strand:+ start:44004 stop:44177 length:174 start_codon:yes stop_codon:yes gene_type:complete
MQGIGLRCLWKALIYGVPTRGTDKVNLGSSIPLRAIEILKVKERLGGFLPDLSRKLK